MGSKCPMHFFKQLKQKRMNIEVRPIVKKQWHGKSGKESFTRTRKIQALVDDNHKYKTGLTEEDIKWLVDGGSKLDLSDDFDADNPHPTWDGKTGIVELKNSTQIYDTQQPLDRIRICIMRGSDRVADSMKEYEAGDFPEATHVLYDEREEVEVVASKIAIKNKAVVKSVELSAEKKAQIIIIMAGKSVKGKSPGFIEVELSKLIDTNAKEVLRIMDRDADDIVVEAFVLEALKESKLTKKGHKFYFFESYLGGSLEEVVTYFKDEENQQLRFKLTASLK